MTEPVHPASVSPAGLDEKPTLARLLQLYLHDFSEFATIGDPHGEVADDGAFAYPHFDDYWTDRTREACLFRLHGSIIGFALINQWSASGLAVDHSMAEFFILRKYRGAGIGSCAAHTTIQGRPGTWEIPVAHYNEPAAAFWRVAMSAITDYRIEAIAGDDNRWSGTIWRLRPAGAPL